MRRVFKLTLMTALLATLLVSPALAKKAPIERTVVDGVTLAEVKPNTQVPPYYPATARVSNPFAEVVLAVEVNEKGKVSNVDVLTESIEDLGFGVAAKDAVRAWRFHPAIENGEEVTSISMIRLTFGPPSLRAPEGFVFTESAPRFYTARHFNTMMPDARDLHQAMTAVNPFVNGVASGASDPRERISKSDLPPCPPSRRFQECMYDKRDMVQFGGSTPEMDSNTIRGIK